MSEAGSNRLASLAADIRAAHTGVRDAARTAAERGIEAGKALLEAKGLVKHGEWLPWLEQNCGLSERTAQLYMKIAATELPASVIAAIGLKGAARHLTTFIDKYYDPFFDKDAETKRQWLIFALWTSWPHAEWIIQRPFSTPDEWMGEDGEAFRRGCCVPWWSSPMSPDCLAAWHAFRDARSEMSVADIETAIQTEQADIYEPRAPTRSRKRRRRKSATVADLDGGDRRGVSRAVRSPNPIGGLKSPGFRSVERAPGARIRPRF